jgi:membrane-associated protease RseP (regulator of RpoE activity)
MADIFEITGPFSLLPDNTFWILANCAYWIFWLNFALGTFNVLPAIPLDGGYLFKDGMTVLVGRIRKSWRKEKREEIAAKITLGMSLLVLASILSLILIPRLKVLFM